MGKKVLKNRVHFTSTMKTELYERLQHYSKETHIPISRILDMAVESFLPPKENMTLEFLWGNNKE